jgi:hypothetical protein
MASLLTFQDCEKKTKEYEASLATAETKREAQAAIAALGDVVGVKRVCGGMEDDDDDEEGAGRATASGKGSKGGKKTGKGGKRQRIGADDRTPTPKTLRHGPAGSVASEDRRGGRAASTVNGAAARSSAGLGGSPSVVGDDGLLLAANDVDEDGEEGTLDSTIDYMAILNGTNLGRQLRPACGSAVVHCYDVVLGSSKLHLVVLFLVAHRPSLFSPSSCFAPQISPASCAVTTMCGCILVPRGRTHDITPAVDPESLRQLALLPPELP